MKKTCFLLGLALAAGMNAQERVVSTQAMRPTAQVERFGGFRTLPARAADAFAVDFTAGEASWETAQAYSFDDGFQGWTPANSDYVTWTTKKIKSGTDFDFSKINPADAKSLYVDGPYQTFRRECAHITSPAITVPALCRLTFWVGMTLNYEDTSSLSLLVSDDDFATETQLWISSNLKGDKPWQWRQVTVDLNALAGKDVKFRLKYGPGTDDMFQTGGYLGDYAVDDFTLAAPAPVTRVDLATGQRLRLTPLTGGREGLSYSWTMPGATPAESNEEFPEIYYKADGDYDITLRVTDATGAEATRTHAAFAHVTGTAPVARIKTPAEFRLSSTRLPLVAPMLPVTYQDASEGYPTGWEWVFTGADADPEAVVTVDGETAEVSYAYLHKQMAGLTVSNAHGESSATQDVSVEYDGTVTNMRPDDTPTTFSMEDWGYFPGSNTRGITAYAEKFSKPSRPIVINGVYAFFTRRDAGELTDQIADIGVHIYSSVNGLPGEKLESWWWQVTDLDGPNALGDLQGTPFPITPPVVIDDEFFVVVDGIPAYKEATADQGPTAVTLGMAAFRGEGNTCYMLKDGVWTDVSEYFPAGSNHTSLMVYPSVIHSVICNLPGTERDLTVNREAGSVDYPIFSYMGWEPDVESDSPWIRVTNTPGEMTVDHLHIEYDALPAAMTERKATLTVTDGAGAHSFTVTQTGHSAADTLDGPDADSDDTTDAKAYRPDGTQAHPGDPGIIIQNGATVINH